MINLSAPDLPEAYTKMMSHPSLNHNYYFDQTENTDLIQVTGNDALEFLNGQFTNNLPELPKNQTSLSAWCSSKGRVLYTFRIWATSSADQTNYWLLLDKEHTDSFLKRLQMFVFRSDVSFSKVTDQYQMISLSGSTIKEQITAMSLTPPEINNEFLITNEILLIKIPGAVSRYWVIVKSNAMQTLQTQLATLDQKNVWPVLDCLAGIPRIYPQTSDEYLPQMLDLENLGALSFNKGCYPGQEIVARTKYRGKLKRQLYLISFSTAVMIEPGSALNEAKDTEQKTVGNIIRSAITEEQTTQALAVILLEKANANLVFQDNNASFIPVIMEKIAD